MRKFKDVGFHIPGGGRKTDGNPEGKGLNGFLRDWRDCEPRGVVVKSRHKILAEFFTSMLILSARFKFRPSVGAAYYLYWINDEWSLSLIAPDEWTDERRAGFAGTCVLQRDMTWTIALSDRLVGQNSVSIAIGKFYDAFVRKLETDLALEEILPAYAAGLPYFQRLYASALSRSLRVAITLGDQAATSCRQWLPLLPQRQHGLPNCTG
ncbi:MAG: DUF2452 domain-containing protein [Woeseiaceae bacterium]|nr:DUF2452 domain-containing protein [Woeseiaceae bacterium]